MRIREENRPSWIQRKHWELFGEAIAVKPRLVLVALQNMTRAIMPITERLAEEFQKAYGTSIDRHVTPVSRKSYLTYKLSQIISDS